MSQAAVQSQQQQNPPRDEYDAPEPPPPPTRWERWRRRLIFALVALIVVAIGAEVFISHLLDTQLTQLVERKLDAQMKIGSVLYVPPYTAWAWNVRLIRNSNELVRFDKIAVTLDGLPIGGGDKPLVIDSIAVDKPVLNALPGAFDNIAKSEAKDAFPRKLSEMLRLNRLKMGDGRIAYYGTGKPGEPPMSWENLSLDAALSQQTPSRYTFQIRSRAAPLADASLSGSIDVDDLLLQLDSMTINAAAQPEPKRSPLPAPLQKFITDNRITGDLVISGGATVPLKDAKQASCLVTIALKDGTALIPREDQLLEHARASIVAQKTPAGPLQIRLDTIDIAGTGRQIFIDGGNLQIDGTTGTFALTDVAGHIQFPPPATAPVVAEEPGAASRPSQVLDDLAPTGRIDFTAAASGPLDLHGQKPWEAIRHEIIAYPRNLSFRLNDFARRFEKIEGGEVRLVNGTIIFQELHGRYADDAIRIRGARLPLQGLPDIQHWREISGSINFNSSPQAEYSPDMNQALALLNPSGAFLVAGNYTFDQSGPGDPRRDFDIIVSSDTGSLTLTDHHITLSKIRGDATITPTGVQLDDTQAELLGGKLRANGSFKIAPGTQPNSYAGDIVANDIDLPQVEAQISTTKPAKPIAGKAYVEATFSGVLAPGADRVADLKALQSNGQYEIVGGNLYTLPVLRNVTRQIKSLDNAATLGDAAATFEIAHGELKLTNSAVNSPVVGLQGSGTINLIDGKINGEVVAAPLADWKDKLNQMRIPLIGDIAGGVQKMLNTATGSLLYAFRISGTLSDVKVAAVPAPALTDAAANVFGHMIKPLKDERPLDWIKMKLKGSPQTQPTEQSGQREESK